MGTLKRFSMHIHAGVVYGEGARRVCVCVLPSRKIELNDDFTIYFLTSMLYYFRE